MKAEEANRITNEVLRSNIPESELHISDIYLQIKQEAAKGKFRLYPVPWPTPWQLQELRENGYTVEGGVKNGLITGGVFSRYIEWK